MSGGRRTRRRRLFRVLLAGMGVVLVALLLLPGWFPWVIKPVARQLGIRYQGYERVGYNRFSLTQVTGTWDNTTVTAARVDAPLPTLWLWSHARGNTNSHSAIARVHDWKVLVEPGPTNRPAGPRRRHSTVRLLNLLSRITSIIRTQLQAAHVTNGEVSFNSTRLRIPYATWNRGHLDAEVRANFFPEPVTVTARPESGSFEVTARSEKLQLALHALVMRETERWDLTSQFSWHTNFAEIAATFDASGWWPAHGVVRANQWNVPSPVLPTNVYSTATASLVLNLVSNQFQLEATSDASPAIDPEFAQTPPLHFLLKAHGTPDVATIEALEARAPWIQVDLSEALAIQRKAPYLTNDAQLRLALDLAAIPSAGLTGRVDAVVGLDAGGFQTPKAQFRITATNLHAMKLVANDAAVRGELAWPRLRLEELRARFADGSRVDVAGEADLRTREIAAANWSFDGKLVQQFVPSIPFNRLRTTGTVRGPLTNLTHRGELAVDAFEIPGLKPINLRTRWEGEHTNVHAATIEARAGSATLSIESGIHLQSISRLSLAIRLQSAAIRRDDGLLYALQQPATVQLSRKAARGESGLNLATERLAWGADDRLIAVAGFLQWPREGAAEVTLKNVRPGDFSEWPAQPLPTVHVRRLDASAQWSNGPVRLAAAFQGGFTTSNGLAFEAQGKVRLSDTIEFDSIQVETAYVPSVTVQGVLPLSIVPGRARGWVVADSAAPFDFKAVVKSVPQFSANLGTNGEVRAIRPNLQFTAAGTLNAPVASLAFDADRLEWLSPTNGIAPTNEARWPGMDQVAVRAEIRERSIDLVRLGGKIEGQLLQIRGTCPLPGGFWDKWLSDSKPPDWSRASGRLQLEHAQVASVARYLPEFLAPEGQVSADVTLHPERKLEGAIVLANAATRPIGKFTPLRDIAATVRLAGQSAVLENFSGQISGQPVRASGKFVIPEQGRPEYQLKLQGSNVPLARSLEFLLRGNLDVALNGHFGEAPAISGEIELHNGLWVQHANAIMLTRPERPNLRPPYFSVTNPPFADWQMNLTVRGARFLRIRTPLFNGVASANVSVRGTLGDPVLTGDVRADSGRMLFPFGTLQVDQAHASFDGNDPRGPELFINASGRNYRYDLRLEVTGPADGANVIFSSTPPLSSEEILLMLTAGELPRNENLFSTEARAGRLATFLGRDLLSRFSGSDSTGERLIINTAESITEEGKTTYSIEYRLTDRWSIIGEYDRFSALNAAVKWKIYSR